ncbi:MAG: GTP-binding protein, partial [Patescibacteria group bacterium]
ADRAGTTRDANKLDIKYEQKTIELIDTAGIRRSGKIETGIEKFSVIRSLSAIEQSDICLLLMDANELNSALDQKLAGMIKEAGKGMVLVITKWDSIDKDAYTRDALAPKISNTFDFVPWAPLIFTSSVSGQNVTKIFDLIMEIHASRQVSVKTRSLNNWLAKCINKHPPAGLKNRNPKLNYMVHEEGNPTPSFKIFGSHTGFLHWSYKRYLEKQFREEYGYQGTAIKFWFIERTDRHKPPKQPKED